MPDAWEDETGLLDPGRARALLERYGIALPLQQVVDAGAEPGALAVAARAIGFPLVLKAIAPSLVHKSDAGGVRLGLESVAAVAQAAATMRAEIPGLAGYLLQEQVAPGVELIVGCRRDETFGPVVLVGLGGVWVEVLQDVALRLAPVGVADARAMLDELRGAAVLHGLRGRPPVDRDALADIIVRVSRLAREQPEVRELDLNPVIAGPDGVLAVDARVVWGDAAAAQPPAAAGSAARRAVAVRRLLAPRSIAVVGASSDGAKPGGRLFRYLLKHGYPGRLYAVNPGAGEVLGHPAFPSVRELPETPDLACVMVPAASAPGVVAECGRRSIPAAVVYAAGFGEMSGGRPLQDELQAAARATGIHLCGPNTTGVVNVAAATCAAFGMAFEVERMPRGEIAFLTQSGALGGSLLSRTWADGIGFSHWVCAGNEADLTISDYLDALVDDPDARVIAIFMETLRDPTAFLTAARRARALGKPIVVYKTGESEVGRRAVQSHTGALAGDNRVYDAAFRACGIARVDNLQALVDAAVALAWQPLPRGRRVGVISASGGACSVIADECARHGLELPPLPAGTVERITEIVPPFGVSQNPVDVTIEITRNPGMIGQVAEIMLAEQSIDALVVLMTTNADPPALEVARGIVRAAGGSDKPVLLARVGAEFLAPASIACYRDARIPLVPMPDRVVRALRAMVDVAEASDPFPPS
jgi:acyl-CoA synthetase (NDP forming)